jgi:hypothetical protein
MGQGKEFEEQKVEAVTLKLSAMGEKPAALVH